MVPIRPTVFVITGYICFVAWTALADEPEQLPVHRVPLATIDIAKIFKEARAVDEKMQRITAEFEATKSGRPNEELQTSHNLRLALPGPAGRRGRPNEELQTRHNRALGEAHREIDHAVQSICRERDIGIVLRIENNAVNPNDRSSILKHVNRPIVYSSVPDLTADVIAMLNKTSQ